MLEQILERVQGILLHPEETWDSVRLEKTSARHLFEQYVIVLAAVPSIAGFLGSLFTGENFFKALFWGLFYYGFLLASIWLAVLVLSHVSRNFHAPHDQDKLFRLVAYSSTAFYLAGVFFLIPPLYWLAIVGLYGFYVFNVGIDNLLDVPAEEKWTFKILAMFVLAFMQILPFTLAGALSGTGVAYLRM
ncbi:YIP1 family protein [candidate division KSB1 bacterium]|nr:YIP1 family protein [candidate division KSB1 bacterium]